MFRKITCFKYFFHTKLILVLDNSFIFRLFSFKLKQTIMYICFWFFNLICLLITFCFNEMTSFIYEENYYNNIYWNWFKYKISEFNSHVLALI